MRGVEETTVRVESVPWRCESCGWTGIVNVLESDPEFVAVQRAHASHDEPPNGCDETRLRFG